MRYCVECEHFLIESETPWYESDPGDGMFMGCNYGKLGGRFSDHVEGPGLRWALDNSADDEASFGAKMRSAETCPRFAPRPAE